MKIVGKRLYNLLRNRVNRELKSLKNNIMQIILRAILTTQKKHGMVFCKL